MTVTTRRQFGRLLMVAGAGLAAPACQALERFAPPMPDDGGPLDLARIVVRPADRLDEISPLLFGSAVEWVDHGNGLCRAATGELRADVIDLLKPLRLSVIRFPGGILADHYHWRDGVGPLNRRPARRSPMDGNEHANTFGTDEYIRFIKAISAEPLVTANVGTGTYEELDAWRRYFDGQGASVPYWELGNEIYLAEPRARASIPGNDERIYHTSSAYAAKVKDWAARLRSGAPRARIGGIAGTDNTSAENRGWLQTLIEGASSELDFVALHDAFAPLILGSYDFLDERRRQAAYRAMFAQAAYAAEDAARVRQQWEAAGKGRPARVAITEHFPLFGAGGNEAQLLRVLDQSRTMASALYTASLFHAWMREGVWLATYNLTLSHWFGGLVTDTDAGLVKTPTYHVFDLYRNRFGTRRVGVSLTGPTFATEAIGTVRARARVEYLDVVGAHHAQGGLSLSVINRRFGAPVLAVIEGLPAGPVEVWTLAAETPSAINGPSLTDSTRASASIQPRGSQWTFTPGNPYTFPPNSVTMLRWSTA